MTVGVAVGEGVRMFSLTQSQQIACLHSFSLIGGQREAIFEHATTSPKGSEDGIQPVGSRIGGLIGKAVVGEVGMTVGVAVGEGVRMFSLTQSQQIACLHSFSLNGGQREAIFEHATTSPNGSEDGIHPVGSRIGGLIGKAIVGEVGRTVGAAVGEGEVRMFLLTHSQQAVLAQRCSLIGGQPVDAHSEQSMLPPSMYIGSEDGIQPVGSRIGGLIGKAVVGEVGMTVGVAVGEGVRMFSLTHSQQIACLQ